MTSPLPQAPSYPNTRAEIDALPYVPNWGHWSLTAWDKAIKQQPPVYIKLAEVPFPVVNGRGPQTPHDVKCRAFAQLDAAARAALGA